MERARREALIRAFTLIELLVVIAIIAILATLALSGMTRAKALTRNAACQNQLRQLGLALSMYVDDYGIFPPYGRAVAGDKMESLLNLLSPYLGKRIPAAAISGELLKSSDPLAWALFHCTEKSLHRQRQLDYGYNVSGVDLSNGRTNRLGLDGERKLAEVRAPADMVALADGGGVSGGVPGPIMSLGPYGFAESKGFVFPVGVPHLGKGNVLFCDSHVESGKADRWTNATEVARRRWNTDHEPHPELWPRKQ